MLGQWALQAAVAARGLVSKPLPQGVALTLVFGVPRSPLPGKFRPTPRCLPQVSERPCLLLGGAWVALPEDTCTSALPPDGGPPRSYDNIWDQAPSPSRRRWPREAPEAEGGLTQWI